MPATVNRSLIERFEVFRGCGSPQVWQAFPLAEMLRELEQIEDRPTRLQATQLLQRAVACGKVMQLEPENYATAVNNAFEAFMAFLWSRTDLPVRRRRRLATAWR